MKTNKIITLVLITSTLGLGVFSAFSLFKTQPKEAKADLPTYQVYIDMNGHGTSRWVDVQSGTTVRSVILNNLEDGEYTDGDYYLIGFNESEPLKTDDEGLHRFYEACYPFLNMQITRSMGLESGWAKMPENPNVFHAPKAKTITKVNKIEQIGSFYFSNVQVPSHFINVPNRYFDVDIETSSLVNSKDETDTPEFAIYGDVIEVTTLTVGTSEFNIYENEDIDKYFYKDFRGDKEFLYIDAYGTDGDFNKVDVDYSNKVVIVNRGGPTFQDKIDSAYFHGAEALFFVNSSDEYLSIAVDDRHEMCVAVIDHSAGAALKEVGTSYDADGITYYTGSLNIAKSRHDMGIPFNGYELFYDAPGATYKGNLYFAVKNPDELQKDTTYQLTISYKVTIWSTNGDTTQEETVMEEKTVITVDTTTKNPDEPDKPSKKKGCGGSVVVTSVVASSIALIGIGLLVFRRKKQEDK